MRTTPVPLPAIWPGREVNPLTPTLYPIGIVSISQGATPTTGKPYFELRYKDPDTGRDVKRRVSGSIDPSELKSIAQNLTREAYKGKGYLAGQAKVPTLKEGIEASIRLSRARPSSKIHMGICAAPFLNFMKGTYPKATTWADLRPSMVTAYVRYCENKGLAYDSIRLRLVSVKAAWRQMHADYPDLVKVPQPIRLIPSKKQEIDCLNISEAKRLLLWMKEEAPGIYPIQLLAALCGLRQLEAAALRAQDVDWQRSAITITDTCLDASGMLVNPCGHKPKTVESERTIPVPSIVLEALREVCRTQKVRPTTGELFTDGHAGIWKREVLSHRMRILLHRAAEPAEETNTEKKSPLRKMKVETNKAKESNLEETQKTSGVTIKGYQRYAALPARKLRSTFCTVLAQTGISDRLLKAYIGHVSGDVFGTHYRKIDFEELRAVSGQAQALWDSADIETANPDWKDSGNTAMGQAANS